MRRFLMVLAVSATVFACGSARASVLDAFDSDTSSKYNVIEYFANSGSSAAAYARNASNQFNPAATPVNGLGATTGFLRNDGYTLNVGDTVSLDVCDVGSLYATGGLTLCPSLTDKTGEREYYVQNRADLSGFGLSSPGQSDAIVTDLAFSAGPVTITATRTSATQLDLTYVYHTASGSAVTLNRTDAGIASGVYYFGMACYDGGQSNCVMDNLSYTRAIPEPASMTVLVIGVFGMLAYAWRKRK